MSKGVVIGVITCVTVLPAMILTFDNAIEKTTHKALIPPLTKVSDFIVKHYKIAIGISCNCSTCDIRKQQL